MELSVAAQKLPEIEATISQLAKFPAMLTRFILKLSGHTTLPDMFNSDCPCKQCEEQVGKDQIEERYHHGPYPICVHLSPRFLYIGAADRQFGQ